MKTLIAAGLACAALALAACATGPGAPSDLVQFEQFTGMTVAVYCAEPLATRQALRDRYTHGLAVIVCPEDLPTPPAAATPPS